MWVKQSDNKTEWKETVTTFWRKVNLGLGVNSCSKQLYEVGQILSNDSI